MDEQDYGRNFMILYSPPISSFYSLCQYIKKRTIRDRFIKGRKRSASFVTSPFNREMEKVEKYPASSHTDTLSLSLSLHIVRYGSISITSS